MFGSPGRDGLIWGCFRFHLSLQVLESGIYYEHQLRSTQSILKESNPEYSLEGHMLETDAPILWPPDTKKWLIGKDPDARKDWGQEEKGVAEDKIGGWHRWLNGHEFEQALGDGEGQGSLVHCSPWGGKELDIGTASSQLGQSSLTAHRSAFFTPSQKVSDLNQGFYARAWDFLVSFRTVDPRIAARRISTALGSPVSYCTGLCKKTVNAILSFPPPLPPFLPLRLLLHYAFCSRVLELGTLSHGFCWALGLYFFQ